MDNLCRKLTDGKLSDFVQGRLQPEEALRFLDAIEQDPEVSEDLDLHVEVLNIAQSADAEVFRIRQEVAWTASAKGTSWVSWGGRPLGRRRVLVPVGVLLVALVAGFALITFTSRASNPFGNLADLGDLGATFRVRGWGGDADLVDAATWLMNGEPDEAARRFERYLRMFPSSEWTPWVEYAAGLSHLVEARRSIFGMRVCYDVDIVRQGLKHLDHILAKADVPELREDALWFRAKGSLMVGDAREAEIYLTRVLGSRGGRSQAALRLLSEIHSLQY